MQPGASAADSREQVREWRGGSCGVPELVSVLTPPSKWVSEPLAGFPAVLPSSSIRKGSWDEVEEDLGAQTLQIHW